MTTDAPTTLSSALTYLDKGLSVFPLPLGEKKPTRQFKWEQLQHALPSPDQVREWFGRAESNIAVVTGKVSRLLAIDIDSEAAKSYTENIIESKLRADTKESIAKTLWTLTGGGGYHVLVRYRPEEFDGDSDTNEIKNAVLWRGRESHSEIRLKSDGAYVVLPPSVHPSGNAYRFVTGNDIVILSKEQLLDLVRGFRQNVSRIKNRDAVDEVRKAPVPVLCLDLDEERVMDAVVILRPHYLEGQRHDFVLYLSGWLRKEGVTVDSARKIVEGLAADDEELSGRLLTLENTYKKESLNEIKGYAGLLEILESQLGSADIARQMLKEVQATFPEKGVVDAGDSGESGGYNGGGSGNKPPSASEIAIGLVDKRAVLYFLDEYATPHLKVKVGEHTETMPVGSGRFELYVSKVFYDEMDWQVLKAESLNEVIRILTARTTFDGVTAKLHLRSAWGVGDNNEPDYRTLFYDPATPTWSCIKVTTQGWEILPRHPESVLFTRFKQLPQVTPVGDYPADVMDNYLDLMHVKGHAARLLVKVLLIASFIPDIGHPITVPNGEQGGVKSTYCRYHKRLVDPCAVELLTIPKDRNEFVQHMYHNYVVVYDNVRIVPNWFSDEICKAVTGVGNSKRKYYTDDEDVAYNYKRCILVNGINNVLTEPDALDRSVMLDFARISDEQRREEAEVDTEFGAMKPGLLGYIFDILARSLAIKPTVKLERKPRMADFAVWGEAIARAMGCKELEFLEVYYSVLERQNVDAVEATLVGPAIVNFVETWPDGTGEWQGSPDTLLDELRKVAEAFRIDVRDRMWPKKGNSLTRKLKPLLPDLRQGYNIDIAITRDTKGEKTKSRNSTWITIRKIPPRSPPSPPAPGGSADDGGNGGDPCLRASQEPPRQDATDHAQNSHGGGSGDGGDTFRITGEQSPKHNRTAYIRKILSADSYATFDLEWSTDSSGNSVIYAAAFVDSQGNHTVLHISDFENSEAHLLQAVTQELLRHPLSAGWYTTGNRQGGNAHAGGAAEAS
jgi:Bifunctional DNA primase/polymerase, N-terminal